MKRKKAHKLFRFLFWFKRIFQRKPKPFLLDGKFKIVPAFELKGEMYYMHEDPINTLSGRGLHAMTFMEELIMRCDRDFLLWYTEAMDKVLSDPKSINIGRIALLNNNLKERLNMLLSLPDHVFKLASVVFFKREESAFSYDHKAARKTIKEWKEAEGMYDFFLRMTPLKVLLPSLLLHGDGLKNSLRVQERINEIHMKHLSEIIFRPQSTDDI